jgi:hypothetical protein
MRDSLKNLKYRKKYTRIRSNRFGDMNKYRVLGKKYLGFGNGSLYSSEKTYIKSVISLVL